MIIPDTYPLTILRGRDFDVEFEFADLNLTGYTARSQIRASESQDATLIEEFTIIVTPGTDSTVELDLSETETGAITQETGFYDLLLTSPSGVDYTYIRGPVTFIGSVTEKA